MDKKKVIATPKLPESIVNTFVGRSRQLIQTQIVPDAPEFIPQYKTSGAACCDLKANIPPNSEGERKLIVGQLQTVKIDAGFKLALPPGYEAQIRARSGLGARGIIVTNSPGTIDCDFRENLCVLLTNLNKEPFVINHLDRIAQLALKPVWYFDWEVVDELDETDRKGGFGSTGVK